MYAFNWADYSIVTVVLISALIGLLRGFVKEALSLMVWGAAFFFSFKFYEPVSGYLTVHITNESLRIATAFAILFGAILILGSILSHLIAHLVIRNGIKSPDRVLGAIFGIARGILIVAVLLLFFSIGFKKEGSWQKKSYFIPKFSRIVNQLEIFLPISSDDGNAAKINEDK
jgi:membrane protein required for colicin V production